MSKINECSKCRRNPDNCGQYDHTSTSDCLFFQRPIDNSKMFSHWYSPVGRIGRAEYFFTIAFAIILGVLFSLIYVAISPNLNLSGGLISNIFISFVVFAIPCYIAVIAGIKRTNDVGLPRSWAFLPVLFLFWPNLITLLLFLFSFFYLIKDKGEDGINEHGSNPDRPYEQQLSEN